MAADWPTTADVQNLLRVQAGDAGDDQLVATDLSAAIAWVTARCSGGTGWVDPGNPLFLPDPLFTCAQYEAARLYRRRDSVDGTIGWGDMGVVRVGPKDPDIETLIAPYLAIVFS
jgi:hypothetical protein